MAFERCRPGPGYRHLVRKADLDRFIALLPDWDELAVGLRWVVLDAGWYEVCGWHRDGVVGLCAWERDLWVDYLPVFVQDHRWLLDRLGVETVPEHETCVIVRWTETTAKAYQLLHVFLHELGHHHDRMTTRSRTPPRAASPTPRRTPTAMPTESGMRTRLSSAGKHAPQIRCRSGLDGTVLVLDRSGSGRYPPSGTFGGVAEWRTLQRAGVRLACRDFGGCGRSVLMLHGLAGHSGEWTETAALLGSGFRIVGLDQRGHGRSERAPEDVSRRAYVADVAAVMDDLSLAPVVLVGQSMGANTALLAAAAFPDRVQALVVVDGSPDGPIPELPGHIRRWLELARPLCRRG